MEDIVYRVIKVGDDTEYRQSGYRNATGLYNTLGGARGQIGREVNAVKRRNSWAAAAGRDKTPIPEFKIQKSRLVWEDVD